MKRSTAFTCSILALLMISGYVALNLVAQAESAEQTRLREYNSQNLKQIYCMVRDPVAYTPAFVFGLDWDGERRRDQAMDYGERNEIDCESHISQCFPEDGDCYGFKEWIWYWRWKRAALPW